MLPIKIIEAGRVVPWHLTWTSEDGAETQTIECKSLAAACGRAYALLFTKGGTATIKQAIVT